MCNVIGTAPAMFGSSAIASAEPLDSAVVFACADPHLAMTAAAAVLPAVRRNTLRFGYDGLDDESSRIGPPSWCCNRDLSYLSLMYNAGRQALLRLGATYAAETGGIRHSSASRS